MKNFPTDRILSIYSFKLEPGSKIGLHKLESDLLFYCLKNEVPLKNVGILNTHSY